MQECCSTNDSDVRLLGVRYRGLRLLPLMPPGCSMEKGKRYDDTIGYAIVVSVSTSYSRCYNLALSS